MANFRSDSDSPWSDDPGPPLMSDFLSEHESNSYKDLIRRDLAKMEEYLTSDLTDEQRAELLTSQALTRPLLDLERLTYGDCYIIDGVVDRMERIGCQVTDDYVSAA
jgi:hypothetical protein